MAIAATAVWRIRTGGNDNNGGGYDAAITGGTDYSQQDAAQLTCTSTLSTSAANSTALLNSANSYTSAMVGNAIHITAGTNFTAGWYFVTAFTSSGNVTLDRTPTPSAAGSGGTGRIGGALLTIASFSSILMPGNTVYIRPLLGSGTDWVETTATSALANSGTATTVSVASATGFPSSGTYSINIGTEILKVTSGAGTTTWSVSRAQSSSSFAAHSSGDRVTLVDYADDASNAPGSGDTTNGAVTIAGEPGTRPCFCPPGRLFQDNGSYNYFRDLMVIARSNSSGYAPIMCGARGSFKNISVNLNGQTSSGLAVFGVGGFIANCDVWGGFATVPTTQDLTHSYAAFYLNSTSTVINSFARGCLGDGIYGSRFTSVLGCVIAHCSGYGISFPVTDDSQFVNVIANNTINACLGSAISARSGTPGTNGPDPIYNNLITNNVTASTYGIAFTDGSTGINDKTRKAVGPNFFYNNNANTNNISVLSTDVTGIDPQYTDATFKRYPNYSIGSNLKAQGYPGALFPNAGWRPYNDPGAVQRQEPAASVLRRPALIGVG